MLFCQEVLHFTPKWIFGLAAPLRFSGDRDDDLAACVSGFDVLQSRHGVGQRVGPVDDGLEGASKEQGPTTIPITDRRRGTSRDLNSRIP